MLPVEILAHIVKLSKYPIGLKVMAVFNVKNYELFIDILTEKQYHKNCVMYMVCGRPHYKYGPAIEYSNGTKVWYYRGKLHREVGDYSHVLGNDYSRNPGPAIESSEGEKFWYKNGLLHREDGPAAEWAYGVPEEWYQNGELHRLDGPAIRDFDGSEEWYKEGKLHREVVGNEDSKSPGPAIINAEGGREWYKEGKLHRDDGPAIEYEDRIEWYKNGLLHRGIDSQSLGPAVERTDVVEWWINGIIQERRCYDEWNGTKIESYEDGKLFYVSDMYSIKRYIDNRLYRLDILTHNINNRKGINRLLGLSNLFCLSNYVLGHQKWVDTSMQNGKYYSEDYEIWYSDGYIHRDPNDGPAIVYPDGKLEYYRYGKLHGLGPAVIYPNGREEWYEDGVLYKIRNQYGTEEWYKEGKLHREDGPAIIYLDGTMAWLQNDLYHRIDGPAIIYSDGKKKWYQNGELHRIDGPAVECLDGKKKWYQNDLLHRIDGPAIEYPNGKRMWYQNGTLHRLDGPAIESENTKEWYINNALCFRE